MDSNKSIKEQKQRDIDMIYTFISKQPKGLTSMPIPKYAKVQAYVELLYNHDS